MIEIVVMEKNTASTTRNGSCDDKHGKTHHGFGVVALKHKINSIRSDRERNAQELEEAT